MAAGFTEAAPPNRYLPLADYQLVSWPPETPGVLSRPHSIAEASKARALLAVVVPIAFPFVIAFALARSGHSLSDYFGLIGRGELSPVRQALMWIAMAAWVGIYVPAAVTALTSRYYIASTPTELIVPSGERFDLANVKSISVRKTFWHKVLSVGLPDQTRRIIVTFARPFAPEILRALQNDSDLSNIPIS